MESLKLPNAKDLKPMQMKVKECHWEAPKSGQLQVTGQM
jgi:hypothetical protein